MADWDERKLRDLRRCVADVGKKFAERNLADSCVGRQHSVPIEVYADEAPDESFSVTCEWSCQISSQGPPAERAHRSHAAGLRKLLRRLGFRWCRATVAVECTHRDPKTGDAIFNPVKTEILGLE